MIEQRGAAGAVAVVVKASRSVQIAAMAWALPLLLSELRGWVLISGDEGAGGAWLGAPPAWLFQALLACYCSFVVRLARAGMPEHEHRSAWAKSLVGCCLSGFGGSLINAALLGVTAPPVANGLFLSTMAAAWWAQHNAYFGHHVAHVLAQPALREALGAGYEVFRCWMIFGWYLRAVAALQGPEALYVGPVVVGVIGGAGGLFLPFSKGLEPLAWQHGGVPWNLESAFWTVLAYHCAVTLRWWHVDADQLRVALVLGLIFFRLVPHAQKSLAHVGLALRHLLGFAPHHEEHN
jgi:hypothetical protein